MRESPTVQKLARLTWIEDSVTHYHLPIPRAAADGAIASKYSDRLDLAQNLLGEWESVLVDGETRAMTTIARSPDLPSAFRAAELWVRTVRPDVSRMKDKDAFWRSRKASPKQIALLQKYGAQVNYHTLTRGAASTLLDQHRAAKSLTGVKV